MAQDGFFRRSDAGLTNLFSSAVISAPGFRPRVIRNHQNLPAQFVAHHFQQ
jgi:hypothetical protein